VRRTLLLTTHFERAQKFCARRARTICAAKDDVCCDAQLLAARKCVYVRVRPARRRLGVCDGARRSRAVVLRVCEC
jgi:hypothetical protein